jgi:hypothetical protein
MAVQCIILLSHVLKTRGRQGRKQGCGFGVRVTVVESECEGILGGVRVGKNVPTPTSTQNIKYILVTITIRLILNYKL